MIFRDVGDAYAAHLLVQKSRFTHGLSSLLLGPPVLLFLASLLFRNQTLGLSPLPGSLLDSAALQLLPTASGD